MSVNDIRRTTTEELFEVKSGDSEFSKTFIFGNEDHTLGNALRTILIQKEQTDFCGYSVPHPYEPKMNIRLQTKSTATACEVLKSGLSDLEETSNLIEAKFLEALDRFKRRA